MDLSTDRSGADRVVRRLIVVAVGAVVIAVALGLDVAADGRLARADADRLAFFVDHRTSALETAARLITRFGSYWVLLAIAVSAAAALRWWGAAVRVACAPLVALLIDGLVVSTTKSAVGRSRPPVGIRLAAVADRSFPSGHAANSAALYLSLGFVVALVVVRSTRSRVLVVGSAVAWCGVIGSTRMVLGVHWPTDVVGGWAIGGAFAALAAAVALSDVPRREAARVEISPTGSDPPAGP